MHEEEPNTCSHHNCELVKDVVPVFLGFFVTSVEYGRAGRKLFRFSRSWCPGGCSVAAGQPTSETVQYCRTCREAGAMWLLSQVSEMLDESSWESFLAGILGLRGNDTGRPKQGAPPARSGE